MKCMTCGYENVKGSIFCQECGSKLTVPETLKETPVIESSVIETQTPTSPVNAPISPEVSAADKTIKKKKSKLPLIIILIILLVVLIGAAATFGKDLFFKSDEDKLIEASVKTQMAKQKALVGEFGFEEFSVDGVGVMEAAVIENLIKGLKINYKLFVDSDAIKVEGDFGVMMNGSELMTVIFHMNKDYVAIGIPALYQRVFYLNWEDIQELMVRYELVSEEEMPDIDTDRVIELIEAYAKALDYKNYEAYKDIDTKKYEDLTYGYLTGSMVDVSRGSLAMEVAKEELSYDGQLYTFDIKMDEYMDVSSNLVDAILEDENLVPMFIEGMSKVLDTVIEQEDIYMYNIIKSMDYEEVVRKWNPDFVDDLNKMKATMIKEIEDGYDEAMNELDSVFEDKEYEDMMAVMKEIYSEIDVESQLLIDNGYIMGTETFITIDDSMVDAIIDNPTLSEPLGMNDELEEFNNLGILFKVKMYQRSGILQIDETINFEGLPNNALNFAELDEMELFEIYQEMIINAESLSSGFMGGF